MPIRKSDDPEKRKLALMRQANTRSVTPYNLGGGLRKYEHKRPKPSLPKMPWNEEKKADE